MNGETFFILRDLKAGCSVDEVAKTYRKTPGHIRNLASKHNVSVVKPKQKYIDYRDPIFTGRDSPMPQVPFKAAKLSGLAKCNDAWAKRIGGQRLTESRASRENARINDKHGLRFPCL
ncbi:hypothetical protein Desaci_4784 (plasmid) [Desulfosporosinus acidiphilus SJ4]|uniref:Uncharacterized protein n=1 Tax=Desulfosporosinus acidiphilus (strain DSM 22704 / JCM 16185 / SJ4) TaxID=646529 RepID=I4DCT4_DESAJ|nr:hypothetical protein [Desulfosporosinus acidiphilus]AFM43608.1 hypothetical protein Desaci_4784 [Desulfosporosinus acidiphilus SJ4]